MIRKKIAIIFCTVFCVCILQGQSFAQSTTFTSGTAIIDMGSTSPTIQNSLKPYGLVYALLKSKNVPVSYVVNANKVKDGIDFVYNNKSYKGGTFIVSADYITSDVTTLLTSWSNQGVVIDYTNSTAGDLTVNVTYKLNFTPKWVMDKTNGNIAVSFLNAAGIPSSAYSFKNTSQLGDCDDIFILPHADPTWNTHNNLYFWNKNSKGAIWAGCHAVSALEGISRDTTISGVPTTLKMNFLSSNGLVSFTDHNSASTPFASLLPGDPVGQYYNKTDNAQVNGSESVYLPKIGSSWNSGAKILTTSPGQIDIPSLSAGAAVENIYGRAFDDANRGYVAYQAAHNIGGSSADQIAAQRIFFNFSFFALTAKVPPIVSVSMGGSSNQMVAGTASSLSATVTGTGTGFTYKWTASVAGTFTNATTANPTFTPSSSISSATSCVITCVVTESCGRVSFDAKKYTVIPPTSGHPLNIIDITKSLSDACTNASITFNVFDGNTDADAGARTLVSVTGLGNGTVVTKTNGDVTFTAAANFKGSTTGTYTITNGIINSSAGNITITVGDATKTPSLTADAITAIVDNVTVINVLGNDKNNSAASNGNLLYIRDISTKPTKGYVYINSDGTVSYLSKKDQTPITGGDSFQYLACNTDGYCAVGSVTVTLYDSTCGSGKYQTGYTVVPITTQYNCSANSFIDQAAASTAKNATGLLDFVGLYGFTGNLNRALFKFDLSTDGPPTNATVNSAVLTLTVANNGYTVGTTTPYTANFFRVLRTWDETTVAYQAGSPWTTAGGASTSQDAVASSPTTSYAPTNGDVVAVNDKITVETKNIVQNWVTTPANNYGFLIFPTAGAGRTTKVEFYSRLAATTANRPKLSINYTAAFACLTIPTNYKPIAYPDTSSTSSNTAITIDVKSNDVNYYGNSNSVTAVTTPAHGTASINGSNNILYTPAGNFVGVDTLTYTITDGSNSQTTTTTVRITVSKVAPTIVRDNASTNSNTAVTINVGSNDTDPQGSMTAPTITSLAKNGTVTVSGNNIVYTPSANFKGNDTLIYKRSGTAADACSTALSDTALVVITVVNQAPVANNDSTTTFACTPVTIKIKDNDTDPENDALTVTIVTNPSNGTLTANTDGSYKYSPNSNFSGTDQFTYTVKDPANLTSNTATVKITVSSATNPNTAPNAVADSDNTLANQSVYTNVLANDSDPNNDPLSISVTASGLKAPTNGTIQLMGNKLIKYTPNANFSGTDTYEYQITDTHPSCAGNTSLTTKALVTIKVTASPILTSGTIWNDVDYSANDSFNNIQTNSETGTSVNGSIYVYLTDSTNTIIDLTAADDAGAYQLSNVPSNTSKLSLILSKEVLSVGGTLTLPSLPSGYANTSPSVRVFSTGTSDITGYDFGIVANSVTGGTISSTSTSFCVTGTPGVISSTVAGTNFVSLQWQSSTTSAGSGFTNITGATSATYTPPSAITTTTWYRRKAIGSGSAYAYSNVAQVTVNPLPIVSISPTSVALAVNATTTLTASGAVTYSWTPATNLSATTGSSVTVTPTTATATTYTVTGTDANGCVNTKAVVVTGLTVPVAGAISGICAATKDSTKTYTVTATNATSFVWTLPSGWSGTSTTNSIKAKAGSTGGTITVVPYNGSVAGAAVTYQVSVIDFVKVDMTGLPVTASGNNNSQVTVTVTLYDANGNRINCSAGPVVLKVCNASGGTFTAVVDNNDGTYTSKLTAYANTVNVCGTIDSVPIQKTINLTFTGPQGGIKPNGPILATETPVLTFTATAGRSPFTIVYRSPRSNKNDTVTNVVSGQKINAALIPATTQYKLVSILDANGETRVNNFNRDTATVIVLAPKVVITLKADPAKADKDSTWITLLRVKTKNIGDMDLTNSQAKLDLSTVFPKPVTFVLDSVTYAGTTVTPNKNYNGVSGTDLFARLSKPRNKVAVDIQQDEMGSTVIPAVNATDDANNTAHANIRVFTNPNKAGDETDGEPVVIEENNSIYMFGPLSYLPVGVEADMILYLHVKPNGFTDPFVMQAVALGTGTTEGATALATSLSNDNNDIASHPEITKQGDPVPTVVNLFPRAVIGASLTAGTPVLQGNGSYNVLLTYKLKNYGNVNLQSVQLAHNLLRSIGSPSTFSLVGPLVSTGDLIINPSFDAKVDTNMLAPNSILAYNKGEGTIVFTINIVPNQLSSIYRLQATASGSNDALFASVTDLTTDGTDPDPDGNNIPSEKIKTVIVINLPIPPLVPGTIGIQNGASTVLTKAYCEKATGVVIIPTSLNTGGTDPYEYQWQSSTDNATFTDIVGATDSTYTSGTITASLYVRRQVISGSQFKFSNSVYIQIFPLPLKPVITGTATQVVGKGSVVLTSTASTAYKWSTGDITRSITALTGGLYTVTVTDANGCSNASSAFTVTTLDPYKVADLQKVVSKVPVLQSDGSFILGFTFLSSNLRSELLDSVKIKDDLTKVFPATVDYQVTQIQASGKLKANAFYNGNSQTDLLADVSQLGGLTTDSIQVYLKVNPNGFSGKLNNTAVLTANSPFGTFSVTSNDPTVGTGIGLRNPTPFTIPLIDIFIPNGFSPNRDGVNDNFVIIKPFGTTINLEIFNRWGNAVYKAPNYNNEWDGRGNQPNNILGQTLPDGTYYYIATATDKFTGTIRKFAGFVELKR